VIVQVRRRSDRSIVHTHLARSPHVCAARRRKIAGIENAVTEAFDHARDELRVELL